VTPTRWFISLSGLLLAASLSACASRPATTALGENEAMAVVVAAPTDAPAGDRVDAAVIAPAEESLSAAAAERHPWSFHGTKGVLYSTPHYRLYTTSERSWIEEDAATFVEMALKHYRSVIAELPPPSRPLDVYIFDTREQWQEQTRQIMKEQASLYLNLGRGGYATRGTAVLYDIGFSDTFSILSHEGWHQYTQTVFKHPLPTWLEEGLATFMEGRLHAPGGEIRFDPWSNAQRRAALERASRVSRRTGQDRLIPLVELLDKSPQDFLEDDSGDLLTYYAQVWALAQFLVYGEDGRYREGLARALKDAEQGRLVSGIMNASINSTFAERRKWALSSRGPGVVLAYFNSDLSAFAEEYAAFVRDIVAGDVPLRVTENSPEAPAAE
jgi:hypothetical protein